MYIVYNRSAVAVSYAAVTPTMFEPGAISRREIGRTVPREESHRPSQWRAPEPRHRPPSRF